MRKQSFNTLPSIDSWNQSSSLEFLQTDLSEEDIGPSSYLLFDMSIMIRIF